MKKRIAPILVLLLTIAMLAFSATPKASQAGLISSILNRMDRNKQSLKTLKANVSMTKYNAQLGDQDTYQGLVLYIPGQNGNRTAFMRLEWTSPQHETLVVANGNYMLYRPRLKTVYYGNTNSIHKSSDSDVLALLNVSASQLRSRFGEPEYAGDEILWGNVSTQHLKVTPKSAASYKYIEVWIDKEGMPVQTKMVEKNDDSTTVRLTNLEKNQNIPKDQFTLNLDSSVRRVKG